MDETESEKEIFNAYKEAVKEKIDKINELIFRLRIFSNPDLKNAYKKYIPTQVQKKCALITGRTPEEIDKKIRESEDIEKEAMEKVYAEDAQKFIFLFIKRLVEDANDSFIKKLEKLKEEYGEDFEDYMDIVARPDFYADSFLDKVAEKKSRFSPRNMHNDEKRGIDDIREILEFWPTQIKEILGSDRVSNGALLYEIQDLLEELVNHYEAESKIKGVIYDFYDENGFWSCLNNEQLQNFLNGIKLKPINENTLKELYDELSTLFSGRLSEKLKDNCIKIEIGLRELVRNNLITKKGEGWFSGPSYQQMRNICKVKISTDKIRATDDLSEYLDFGQCRQIILEEWGLFENIFTDPKYGFLSKNDFDVALDFVKNYRNKIHGTPYQSRYKDMERLKIYLEKINKCIDHVLNK